MLYIVATPIGNMSEITLRAIEVLQSVDVIASENPRHSLTLLNRHSIKKPLISYQRHNEREQTDAVIELLKSGKNVALISDAGMPMVSDPGSKLTDKLIELGLEFTVISGACACINALVLSGMDASSFCFVGFLPERNIDRKRLMDKFKNLESTLLFYVAPHNIDEDLEFLFQSLGRRAVAIVREISKIYEQTVRGYLGEQLEFMHKGEFVVVVSGAQQLNVSLNELTIREHYSYYIEQGCDKKTATKNVALDRNVAKSLIYKELLEESNYL